MPRLVVFLARHAAIGFAVAAVFVGALVAFDIHGLGSLLQSSADGPLALGILAFAMGLTFASAQMGFAVMLMTEREDGGRGGRRAARQLPAQMVLQPVRVHARRSR